MVSIDIFAGSHLNQFLRTLIAITFLIIADVIYYFFTGGLLAGTKFYKGEFPWLPYITAWLTLGSVFGVVEFQSNNKEEDEEDEEEEQVEAYRPSTLVMEDLVSDSAFFGMIIGLIVYTVLTSWLYYVNGSPTIAFMNLCFGIVSCVFSSMFTHIIAHNNNLYG